MTYGPQPGWNPNQPQVGGVGGQPGYPQQPGYPPPPGYPQPGYPQPQSGYPQPTGPQPVPGQPMPGQPMPGQAPMGQAPMGQFGPAYGAPAGPTSPLPVIAGALALLSFVYTVYATIIMLLRLIPGTESVGLAKLVIRTSFVAQAHGRVFATIMTIAVGVFAVLYLIGAIALLRRRPSGRVVAVIASVGVIAISVIQIIENSAHFNNAFVYLVPAVALIVVVLCVLPATGQAMRRPRPSGYQPGYGQPPGAYQQPPGQQPPPGGMPR